MLKTIKTTYLLKLFSIGLTVTLTFISAHAALPTLGDPTLDSFSSKEERQLGLAFYRSLRANLTFIDDLQINYYLNSMGQRLASRSDAAGDTFRFFIIKAPTINAFAGPAGQSTALTIATLLAAILVGTQDSQAGQAVLMSGIAGSQQSSINFTRSNEYEADRVGIGILSDTSINPQGMVEFFEILLDQSPDNGIEYLRTHPLSSNRVSEAKNRLSDKTKDLPKDSLDFQYTKARLIVQLSKQPEYYLDDEVVGTNLIGQYQKALAAIRVGKEDIAIEILSKYVEKHTHPWIRLALAEAYTSDNNNKKALETLSALAKLYPGYLPVTMAYVSVLNSNNAPDKSIALLKKQLQTDDYAIIYKALANAYFANGQISAALESTGNQYARQGYIELAIQQYDNALKQDDISPSTKKRLETQKQELKKVIKRYKEQH